jgi:hypothetical protein
LLAILLLELIEELIEEGKQLTSNRFLGSLKAFRMVGLLEIKLFKEVIL